MLATNWPAESCGKLSVVRKKIRCIVPCSQGKAAISNRQSAKPNPTLHLCQRRPQNYVEWREPENVPRGTILLAIRSLPAVNARDFRSSRMRRLADQPVAP